MTVCARAGFRAVSLAITAAFAMTSVVGLCPQTASASAQSGLAVAATGVKPVIQGLIDRQGPPPVAVLSAVHAYVVKVNWADLQPTAFGPIASNNAIDNAIARVSQPDFAQVGMALKLRVFAGIGAPNWAKSLGGSPVPYYNNQPGAAITSGTIGRFWTADFTKAYADLQTKLAARYDGVSVIREVTLSQCTTIYDEPFVRQFGDTRNITNMQSAGYTVAADKQCIASSIAAHSVWKYTTTDVDFSPFPLITKPTGVRDLAFTESMIDTCRAQLGVLCGMQNNGLSTTNLATTQYAQMYQYMASTGPTIAYQTDRADRIGNKQQVLQAAIKLGANSLELPLGYASWPTSLLLSTANGLLANPTSG